MNAYQVWAKRAKDKLALAKKYRSKCGYLTKKGGTAEGFGFHRCGHVSVRCVRGAVRRISMLAPWRLWKAVGDETCCL